MSCSLNFHHWPLLALLVALVLHKGDLADLNFAILCMIIDSSSPLGVKIGVSAEILSNAEYRF